jgi:hypothetical protein
MPALSATSPFPVYVDSIGWTVSSNAHWTSGGASIKVLAPQSLAVNPRGEPQSLIWSSTCARGTQTIDLSRDVQLPGPPASLMFTLDTRTSTGIPTGAGFFPSLGSLRLVVNGKTAVAVTSATLVTGTRALNQGSLVNFDLGASERDLFHYGLNAIHVVVVKNPLPAGAPACNTSPAAVVGIAFALEGTSAADLSVSSGKAKIRYLKLRTGQTLQVLDGTFVIHNNGPSAAIGGSFGFDLQPGFEKLTELGIVGQRTAPFETCTETPNTVHPSVVCPYTVFPPGESGTVRITLGVDVSALTSPTGSEYLVGDDDVIAGWGIGSGSASAQGTPDPNPNNNSFSEDFHLCGPNAKNPGCTTATSGAAGA